jgi:Lon-like protease
MTRRTVTLLVAGLMLIALLFVAANRPVPYVVMRPGPVENTLGEYNGQQIVSISGTRVYPTEGRLDLTTVRVTGPTVDLSLSRALTAWFDPDQAVVPREVIYPPEQTAEESEQESTIQMTTSQDAAKVAALTELGYDLTFDVRVAEVLDGAPAMGHLRKGDVIVAVGGTPVERAAQVAELLQRVEPGDDATIEVRREGRTIEVVTPTESAPDDPGRTVVGIQLRDKPNLPFEVDIEPGDEIGGPSAGLMFSLAIIDKLTPDAMTAGKHIAGTGEISDDGSVGPIGAIQQKIAASAEAGAIAFLAPADNCAEGLEADDADDLTLVRVSTLSEARDAVEALADDPTAEVPTC